MGDLFWADEDGALHLGDKPLALCSKAELIFGIEHMAAAAEAMEQAQKDATMVVACDILAKLGKQAVM